MVLPEAVTAAAECLDTSYRPNFCAKFSAGKTELRDAIAAGAAPLVGSAQITADGTSCAESPYLAHEESLSWQFSAGH